MNSHPDALVGRWVRSWEEDVGDTQTYRLEGFDFPLSRRPRGVLELQADGQVVGRSGGPADAMVAHAGRWAASDPTRLTVRWDAPDDETEAEIVERREGLLRLRPLRGAID